MPFQYQGHLGRPQVHKWDRMPLAQQRRYVEAHPSTQYRVGETVRDMRRRLKAEAEQQKETA